VGQQSLQRLTQVGTVCRDQARGNGGIGQSGVGDRLVVACENKGLRREFAAKPKGMNKQTRKTKLPDDGFMTAPGYPFSARDIFGDLRSRLAAEHRRPMSFERLAKMLGRSKSTTYNALSLFEKRGRP
jgi:hypothetical protein